MLQLDFQFNSIPHYSKFVFTDLCKSVLFKFYEWMKNQWRRGNDKLSLKGNKRADPTGTFVEVRIHFSQIGSLETLSVGGRGESHFRYTKSYKAENIWKMARGDLRWWKVTGFKERERERLRFLGEEKPLFSAGSVDWNDNSRVRRVQ